MRITIVTSLVALFLALAGCGSEPDSVVRDVSDSSSTDASCEPEQQTADEPLANAGISTIYDQADLVVVGTVASTRENVVIGPDEAYTYDVHSLSIEEVLKGDAPASVEVALMSRHGCHPISIESRAELTAGSPAMWILNKIDPRSGFEGYRLTAMPGLVATVDGRIEVPPETVAGRQANKAGDLEELAEELTE
jgi:hypothetical protein